MKPFLYFASFLISLNLSHCFIMPLHGQKKQTSLPSQDITGDWLITINYFNNPMEQVISLKKDGSKLTAHFMNDTGALSITQNGNILILADNKSSGSKTEYEGTFKDEEGTGTVRMYDSAVTNPLIMSWKAVRLKMTPPSAPQRIDFIPNSFERGLSSNLLPVLHIWPKDTVHTESVDAGGTDKNGTKRVLGGNPLTGPFYVETALPGDVLAITITRLRLNRSWAISSNIIVDRALTNSYSEKNISKYEPVKWNLNIEKGLASPAKPGEHMKSYVVPVRPMLGCVGVAPRFGSQPIGTGDSGPFGGNMDFNQVVEGATVYLPVFRAGGFLFLGDAHARQGDGELTGDALETSMDIEFTVRVIKDRNVGLSAPRVENATYIMTVGLRGSLDDAFKQATTELANWLKQDYKLTYSETAQVFGTAIEYEICEVADRNVGIVAKIKKEHLAHLNK